MEYFLKYNHTILRIKSNMSETFKFLKKMFGKYIDVCEEIIGKEDYTIDIIGYSLGFGAEDLSNFQIYNEKLEKREIQVAINKTNKIILLRFIKDTSTCYEEEQYYVFRFIRKVFLILEFGKGRKMLHSGCVEYHGDGISIIGDKFSGKTTTIINLIKDNEFSYVSNDKIILDCLNDNLRAVAIPIAMGVRY